MEICRFNFNNCSVMNDIYQVTKLKSCEVIIYICCNCCFTTIKIYFRFLTSGCWEFAIICGTLSQPQVIYIFSCNYLTILYVPEEGNHPLLREKVLSITGHITNTHHFPGNDIYVACPHGDVHKQWLQKGSKVTLNR